MATSTLDIEVELKGADKAQKGLKSVGDTAGNVAQRFDKTNSHLGEGISSLSDNVNDLGGSFKDLGTSISSVGSIGVKGLSGLVPAISGVVLAGMALYDTFKNITGAAQEAENAQEAMAAAAGDLQSKLEELAEKGVIPTSKALEAYASSNIRAQIAKERVQMAGEKLSKVLGEEEQAQQKLNEATLRYRSALEQSEKVTGRFINLEKKRNDLAEANREHTRASVALNEKLLPYLEDQRKAQVLIAKSAKMHKDLEDTSLESTISRVKEKQAELANLKQIEAGLMGNSKREEEALKRQAKLNSDLLVLKVKENEKDVKALSSIEKKLDAQIKAYDEETILISQSIKEEQRAAQEINKNKIKEVKNTALREAALKKQHLLQSHQLEIARMKFTEASSLDILEARYQQQRQLAKDNNTLLSTLQFKFETEKTKLIQAEEVKRRAEEAKRLDQQKQRELQRREFIISNLEFDAGLLEDGTKKELSILELKYRRERELKENSEEELTELSRRFNLEREQIQGRALKEQMQQFKELSLDVAQSLGTSLTEVFYGTFTDQSFDTARQNLKDTFRDQVASEREALSKFKGSQSERIEETIKTNERLIELQKNFTKEKNRIGKEEENALPKAVGEVLVALGQQAAVESLMFGAKAVASLFTNPALSANYGIASGVMAAAAVTAGASGRALGASGGGGGGGAPSISPTGLSQIAPEPERERAETAQTIFNINFGGAVVYDTKQAAERAFADRLTQLQNTRRRGAPRRSF
jgi:hypothetical protein